MASHERLFRNGQGVSRFDGKPAGILGQQVIGTGVTDLPSTTDGAFGTLGLEKKCLVTNGNGKIDRSLKKRKRATKTNNPPGSSTPWWLTKVDERMTV